MLKFLLPKVNINSFAIFIVLMRRIKFWLLSIGSGVVLALSWPEIGSVHFLIYFAFFGLLSVEDELAKTLNRPLLPVLAYAYVTFFIFNLITTWWIYYASPWGAVAAIVFNSLFMSIVFSIFHLTKRRIGRKEGYVAFVIYWLAFEYLHLNWDLSWPWLTLGNVFASTPENVQWYEYTGVLGGSLLILVANLLFFFAIKTPKEHKVKRVGIVKYAYFILLILFSMLLSAGLYSDERGGNEELEVVIVQPNIDPYVDKFHGMAESDQIDRMIELSRQELGVNTDVLVLPETAFPQAYWEHEVEYLYGTEELRKIIDDFPKLRIIVGLSTSILFLEGEELPSTARKLHGEGYYDNYNTAMQLDSTSTISFHHKSKLVLGVEKVPFIQYLPFMKKLSINLGGAAGGYGTQEIPSVFFDKNGKGGIAPIICYESVYGEYVNQYAEQGASLYAIITNDGWWDNTPGYRQHLAYARLRAIEGRRDIVRSANTGISAIIDHRGELINESTWWEQAVIKGKVSLNEERTFYIQYGDYIGRIAAFLAVLLVLWTLVKYLNKSAQRLSLDSKS